jgi:hypothetical protein
VIINRVAISEFPADPAFARILTSRGRGSVVPKLERYLEKQRARGRFEFQDAKYAAEILVGLVIGDQQVRRLLGSLSEPAPIAGRRTRGAGGESISHAFRDRLARSPSG